MIELRALTSDDWRLWRGLRLAALGEAPYAFGSTLADWQGEGDREERWRSRLEIPGAVDLVAFVDGEPAGMASGVPGEDAEGKPDRASTELISMWVGPAARGRGVGERLIREIELWAATRGCAALKLAVMPDNERAIALYERAGFTRTGEEGDLLADGVRRELVLAKPVSAG
ncbi:GNAT family N-acetyltransferase [Streptomyces sp. BE20]|uniref:GNAT family N-acetyltransferase n=1 Tax=Streptomyces sp. BE20 TaxID=3002525 RepID=UPI002E77EFA5|nr:GNAT family N-acetyltransferase [Streptomyces sp. BE20]MEE1822746.1 GNAT family N-acetyltransferase [Streptomyces sp. BE20]